ncbi:MAG: TolC family protein [Bacteroides sp.]|nr:TolC family protein [Bacteroides sp.]
MKPIIAIALLSLAAAFTASAATPWSLDSCINYAVSHNLTVKSRQLSAASAEIDVTSAKDAFLPTLSAGANQSFSFGRGLTAENTYANRNTSNFGWNAGLSLPVFQGMRRVRNLDYARTNLRMVIEQLESAKDDITLNVIAQYLQVLYYGEIHRVATEQLNLSNVELTRRRELLAAGKIPELDILQAESQVAQDELSVVTALNDRSIALLDLAQLLELESSDGFDIELLGETPSGALSPADELFNAAMSVNHSVKASRLGVEAAGKSVEVAKSGYLPTLSFSAGIGSSYYKVSGYSNEGFGPQMRHNLSKSLGISLNIPIFDAFSTRNSVRRAKVQEISARLQLKDSENRLYKAIVQAHAQAIAAEKRLESSRVATESTLAALNAMREKYNYGKANATEFEQAKTEYIRAVSTAVQAKYESLLRRRILTFYSTGR